MKKTLVFVLSLLFTMSCTAPKTLVAEQKESVLKWSEVKSEKANFSVECPPKKNASDLISVKYNDKNQTGSLNCRVSEMNFFVHTEEWNVAEDPQENSGRYFKTLPARGEFSALEEVFLNHEGGKGVEGRNSDFKSIGQYFIIDKTAYFLEASFLDKSTLYTEKGKLNDGQIETARRFFDSFKLLRKER